MQDNIFHKKVSMSHVPVYLELIVGISYYPFHITVFPMRFSDTNPNDRHLLASSLSKAIECYMLDRSICHFRGAMFVLSLLFYFLLKVVLANTVDPDQTSRYVASDLGLHSLPMTLLRVSR